MTIRELTEADKERVINWICSDGQAKGILEDGEIHDIETTREDVEDFIRQCKNTLIADY